MDIIRAWKDEEYRNSLSAAERATLPENPAGLIALTDEDLGAMAGGRIAISKADECPQPSIHCESELCSRLCLSFEVPC